MTITPLLAPPEAQPTATPTDNDVVSIESLARPFRLGLVGLGAAIGLFARLMAANNFGDLNSRTTMLAAAATSALIGLGLLLMAAERDRFAASMVWISGITALAWGALNWISPPFAAEVTVWSKPDQAVLAVLGIGNGLLVAGLVALAFVRRHPTLSVAATMVAGAFAFAADTVALRSEWTAILCLGFAFALTLVAWDRSPRHEVKFIHPTDPPRVSRAALSLISVALCGTAVQLWLSRMDIPRSIPVVALCVLLIGAAFASLIRVRREIEQRETTFSEWTSWMREIRTSDFRADMVNFESSPTPAAIDARPPVGPDGQAPRPLSFPNLTIHEDVLAADEPVKPPAATDASRSASAMGLVADSAPDDLTPTPISTVPEIVLPSATASLPRIDTAPPSTQRAATMPTQDRAPAAATAPAASVPTATTPRTGGAFSAMVTSAASSAAPTDPDAVAIGDLDTFSAWLTSPVAAARQKPLIVAVEAMSLDEFDSLPADDAAMATSEIGSYLADLMPTADLVSWIDGPYFIVAHASQPDRELLALNKEVRKALKPTDGAVAFLRPGSDAVLDDIVNEAVLALLQARRLEQRSAGR